MRVGETHFLLPTLGSSEYSLSCCSKRESSKSWNEELYAFVYGESVICPLMRRFGCIFPVCHEKSDLLLEGSQVNQAYSSKKFVDANIRKIWGTFSPVSTRAWLNKLGGDCGLHISRIRQLAECFIRWRQNDNLSWVVATVSTTMFAWVFGIWQSTTKALSFPLKPGAKRRARAAGGKRLSCRRASRLWSFLDDTLPYHIQIIWSLTLHVFIMSKSNTVSTMRIQRNPLEVSNCLKLTLEAVSDCAWWSWIGQHFMFTLDASKAYILSYFISQEAVSPSIRSNLQS